MTGEHFKVLRGWKDLEQQTDAETHDYETQRFLRADRRAHHLEQELVIAENQLRLAQVELAEARQLISELNDELIACR